MSGRKALINIAKLVLTGIVLYFLGRQLFSYWDEVKSYDWSPLWVTMVFSLLLVQGGPILFAQSWRMIIRSFGYPLSLAHAFKITYLSNLGRYLPGKVWQVFGLIYLTGRAGVAKEPAGISFVLIQFFSVPSALLVWAVCAQIDPTIGVDQINFAGPYTAIGITTSAIAGVALLVFYPGPFVKLINQLLALLSRPAISFELDKIVALKVLVSYFLGWIVYGLAFWLFLMGVSPTEAPGPIASIGIFCLSYQVGYLMLFAPGGFGPRELVMGTLLTPYFGPLAPALAILARLWSMLVDGTAALAALKIRL